MNVNEKIDDCKYLYLRELSEPEDNCLRIIIEEAKSDRPAGDIKVGDHVISGSRAIESDNSCCLFEIVWPTYVAYSVRNESFVSNDETEKWDGRLFCLYSESHFFNYVQKGTFADEKYPGPLKHWGINCLNHIIDIISHADPEIKVLPR